MRSARISFWGSVLLFVLLSGSTIVPNASWAELAGLDLARTVALGWTEVIIRQKGHWSGSRKPTVSSIEPVRQDGSLVGYYAKIDPMGFIVLSADTELPPVKAYSTRGQFDINAEALPIRALRYKLLDQNQGIDTYKRLKQQRDPSIEAPDHGETWSILSGTGTLTKGTASRMDYLGGQTLLSTLWNQTPPYNARCPNKNCNQHTCLNAYDLNSVVGCVGLAGAQVMRYWSWPPYGENSPYNVWYDWRNMPDKLECDSPQAEIDAVSELCFLVGHAAGTDYGCSGSGAMFSGCPGCGDLLDTFEDHYFYSEDADDQGRDFIIDPFGTMWFETIMDEVNKNRPVPYAFSTSWLEGHTVVVDGWQIVGSLKQYHINWGHGDSEHDGHPKNYWYTLDQIYTAEGGEELLRVVRPQGSLLPSISEVTYSPSWKYVPRDTEGVNVVFSPGNTIQFLEGVTLTGTGNSDQPVRLQSETGNPTSLYSSGILDSGIKIYDGAEIRLMNGGGVQFDPVRRPRYPHAYGYVADNSGIKVVWESGTGGPYTYEIARGSTSFTTIGTSTATYFVDNTVMSTHFYQYKIRSISPRGAKSQWSVATPFCQAP